MFWPGQPAHHTFSMLRHFTAPCLHCLTWESVTGLQGTCSRRCSGWHRAVRTEVSGGGWRLRDKNPTSPTSMIRRRKLSSGGGGGCKAVSNNLCTESIKHQKENVPNINWPTTFIFFGGGGRQNTPPPPTFSLEACPRRLFIRH